MPDFFLAYLEGKVFAVLPPYVRMPQNIAEKTMLTQLLKPRMEEQAPDSMIQEPFKGAKRTCYDVNTRRTTFVLPDQVEAAR